MLARRIISRIEPLINSGAINPFNLDFSANVNDPHIATDELQFIKPDFGVSYEFRPSAIRRHGKIMHRTFTFAVPSAGWLVRG
jgi:hypothetical protein